MVVELLIKQVQFWGRTPIDRTGAVLLIEQVQFLKSPIDRTGTIRQIDY